jgi:RNA polymerase sigma-70 factor (ECF subfamily)
VQIWEQLNTEEGAKGLVRDYAGRLYGLAYRLCGNAATSEDLAMRTIERAVRSSGVFASEKAFFAFLCTILVNLHRDDLRLKAANALAFMEKLPEAEDGHPDPAEALALKADAEAIRNAVGRLSPLLRETVVLRYYSDLSIAETANALGVPEGTVKFRLSEARRKIRAILTQRPDDKPR